MAANRKTIQKNQQQQLPKVKKPQNPFRSGVKT